MEKFTPHPHLFVFSAVLALLCACRGNVAEVRPAVADDYVATTGAIASQTTASAQRISREARALPETPSREIILLESDIIAALNGPATATDLKNSDKHIASDRDKAVSEARALREVSVAQAATMSQLQSHADALAGEIAQLHAQAEEARRNNINWVFLVGSVIAGLGTAGFGLLFWLQHDRDWLVLSASCAAGAVVPPFIPALINSLWFKIPVGAGVLAFLGWMAFQIYQSQAQRKAVS